MLATSGQAILAALKAHRHIADKVRAVERLPQMELKELLQKYAADAPAFYLLPGTFRTVEDDLVISFPLAAVVRNVRDHDAQLAGDGQDIGLDHMLVLAMRALHGHMLGSCSWRITRGELVDDPIFDTTGVAALEMTLESSPIPIEADWALEELDSFQTFHADVDLAPHAGDAEYDSWLQVPPVYTNTRPDADIHVSLEGA